MKPYDNPPDTVQAMSMPVLVMQGTADYNVPYQLPTLPNNAIIPDFMSPGGWNDKFASSTRVTLKVFQDLSHFFMKVDTNNNPFGVPYSWPAIEMEPSHVEAEVITEFAAWINNLTF